MKSILFFSILVLCISCQEDVDINGHWHIEKENSKDSKYIVMDIENDTIASIGKNTIFGEVAGDHNLAERKLFFPGDCGMFQFDYKMNGDKLMLENHLENWVGQRCDTLCCARLDDFKNDLRLEINFPVLERKGKSFAIKHFETHQKFENIIFGESKNKMLRAHTYGPVLELEGKISDIDDLKYWIDLKRKNVAKENHSRMIYRIIADKKISTTEIEKIVKELKNKNIQNYYLTCASVDQNKNEPIFLYVHLEEIELGEGSTLEDLLEKM